MLYIIGIGIGWTMIVGAAGKMFYEFNKSVMIRKEDFEKIEKKIRVDERRKVIEQFNKQNQ